MSTPLSLRHQFLYASALLLLLLTNYSGKVGALWTTTSVSSYDVTWDGATWCSQTNAILVGARTSSSTGAILTTMNSGITWTLYSNESMILPTLSDVSCYAPTISSSTKTYTLAVGYSDDSGYAFIYLSQDGGLSWATVFSVTDGGNCRFYSVSVGSSGTAYAVGYNLDSQTAAIYTSRFSTTTPFAVWTPYVPTSSSTFSGIQLNAVATDTGIKAVSVGRDRIASLGVVYYTLNSGTTWNAAVLSSTLVLPSASSLLSSSTFFSSVSMKSSTAFFAGSSGIVGYAALSDSGTAQVYSAYAITQPYSSSTLTFNSDVPPPSHIVSAVNPTNVYIASSLGYVMKGTYTGASGSWSLDTSEGKLWNASAIAGVAFYTLAMYDDENGIAGVSQNTAIGARTSTLYIKVHNPSPVPTPAPSPAPTTSPPTYSATLLAANWFLVAQPGSGQVGVNRAFQASCWAGSSTILLAGRSGDNALIVRSTDGGSSWTGSTISSSLTNTQLQDIAYAPIAASGTIVIAIGKYGFVYYSSDKWATFTAVYDDFSRLPVQLNSVAIGTSGTAFIVGNYGYVYQSIYKGTADSYKTWTDISADGSTFNYANLYGVYTSDGNTVYAVGAAGAIYISSNSGTSWRQVSTSATGTKINVDFYSVSCGSLYYDVTCFVGGNSGTILKTTNGGYTWSSVVGISRVSGISTASFRFHSITMVDSKIAFVASSNGYISSTLDAGSTWTSETSLTVGQTLTTISLYKTNAIVAADQVGRCYLRLPPWPTGQPTRQPSRQPSGQPTRRPTGQPSRQPTTRPSIPTGQPSSAPSRRAQRYSNYPTGQPTRQPTTQPSRQPTGQPTRQPTGRPTRQPSGQPTSQPSRQPSGQPTINPTKHHTPTGQPTSNPSHPTSQPSSQPSRQPTSHPSHPTGQPSRQPSSRPTSIPTHPTGRPTRQPSSHPSRHPSSQPSRQPSAQPVGRPSGQPTRQPSSRPSRQPTSGPTQRPSHVYQTTVQFNITQTLTGVDPASFHGDASSLAAFSATVASLLSSKFGTYINPKAIVINPTYGVPTPNPTPQPTPLPSSLPTIAPTAIPTTWPSFVPTPEPTARPTSLPTFPTPPSPVPSAEPSPSPSALPSAVPSARPTFARRRLLSSNSASVSTGAVWWRLYANLVRKSSGGYSESTIEMASASEAATAAVAAVQAATQEALAAASPEFSDTTQRSHRRLTSSTSMLYTVTVIMQNLGYASASAAYNATTTALSTAVTSGTFTTTLQSTAYKYGAGVLANVAASTVPVYSAFVTAIAHTTPAPTAAPSPFPSFRPTPTPTKYYTLTLTYVQFQVVTSICTLTAVFLILVGGYFYYKRASQISRFQQALAQASMSKEDRALSNPLWRGLKKCARYACCLFLCFKAKTPEEEEAARLVRMRRAGKRKKEGFCRRCCRWLCCCYCLCNCFKYCCRFICPEWCKKPVEEEEEDVDAEGGNEFPEGESIPGGLRGSGGLGGSSTNPFAARGDGGSGVKSKEKKKWGGKVKIVEANEQHAGRSPDSDGDQADGKSGGKSFFSAIGSIFGGGKKGTTKRGADSAHDEPPEEDDWAKLQRQMSNMKNAPETLIAPDVNDRGDTIPDADDGEFKEGERKKFRRKGARERGESGDSPDEETGMLFNSTRRIGNTSPILTAADLASAARNVKKKDDTSQHPNVPSLPTPGDGRFLSFRDNLKLLEMRRIQETRKTEKSSALMQSIGGGYAKKYAIQAVGSSAVDNFLRDDKTEFLGSQI